MLKELVIVCHERPDGRLDPCYHPTDESADPFRYVYRLRWIADGMDRMPTLPVAGCTMGELWQWLERRMDEGYMISPKVRK